MRLIKRFLPILFLFGSLSVAAQSVPDNGPSRVRIILPDKQIIAELNPVSSRTKAKSGLWYFWYDANTIHSTQGGFAGKLLNGSYEEFFPNKNLATQGNFKRGLKDGRWKQWDENGQLIAITIWEKGIQRSGEHTSFWHRLPLLRHKRQDHVPDTVKKAS